VAGGAAAALVVGDPGAGKTRLLEQVGRLVEERHGARVVTGHALDTEALPPYHPLARAPLFGPGQPGAVVAPDLLQGMTNRDIASTLFVSERTVMNHLSHILDKLGVENRAAATAYAIRHGVA
jgi:energy-coupling factor transporter ATP-binding protein EcfA2